MKKIKLTKKQTIILISILAVLVIGIVLSIILVKANKSKLTPVKNKKVKTVEKVSIIDVDSNSRPFAFMINNDDDRQNMSGIQDAYLIYDIIEEGGISRFMALFLDKDTKRIGNIRSTRHYYIDYVLENDAILCHNGQSDQAAADFHLIDRIEIERPKTGIRDNSISYYHSWNNLFTSMDLVKNGLGKKRTERNNELLFEYSAKSIKASEMEGAVNATNVEIVFSNSNKPSFEYNADEKVYYRFMNGKKLIDNNINEQFKVKNIITYQVENYSLNDYVGSKRQGLKNLGSGSGYYITEGVAVPITWEKKTRSSQTIYKYLDGKEVVLNDGNTMIELQPTGQRLTIS